MSLRLHNTLTRVIEPFVPLEDGHVRMYVCGMTIYDLCHIRASSTDQPVPPVTVPSSWMEPITKTCCERLT